MSLNDPVPSNAPDVLLRNAQDFDKLINSSGNHTNRVGNSLPSYIQAIAELGFDAPLLFASGIVVDSSRKTVEYNGARYFAKPSAVPFTTTATFNPSQWALFDESFAGSEVVKIDTFSLLRAYSGSADLVYVAGREEKDDGFFGFFFYDPLDLTSIDNDIDLIVDSLSRRWKKQSNSLAVMKNYLWAGEFACWPMGHALNVGTEQRAQCPSGVTVARNNFTTGATVYHVEGTYSEDAIRLQRTTGNASTENTNIVMNLTRAETKSLAGKTCVLMFNGLRGVGNSGVIGVRVQYSIEPEQPILNSDGTYTNGNQNIWSGSFNLALTARAENQPFLASFIVPIDASQVSVIFTVSHSGTASDSDYVDLESVSLCVGNSFGVVLRDSFSELMQKSASRYQTTYPYGAPRGTNTEQGAINVVAGNTNVNWAFAYSVQFSPRMANAPQFLFQSPASGTESRLLNKNSGLSINGLAFGITDTGVTITNNAAVSAGDRLICHWTAQSIF